MKPTTLIVIERGACTRKKVWRVFSVTTRDGSMLTMLM